MAWEDTPGGGPGIEEILNRISGQLDDIGAKLAEIENEEIPAVARETRSRIAQVWRAAAVFAVAVALALGALAAWSHRQDDVSIANNRALARRADAAAIEGCLASNRFRAREEAFDDELIAVLPRTSPYKEEAAALRADARAKNKPRDCSHPAAGS